MKRLLPSLFCLFFFLFIVVLPTFADTMANPSLSDAVYADLALKGYLDNVSVSFYDKNPANAIAINETRHWPPASTVKLFTAMYASKLIADARLNLYNSVAIEAKNVVPGELITDELPTIQEGEYLTVDRLLKQMITQSDNTAFNVLLDILDRKEITSYIHSLGLIHSTVGSKLNLDTSQEQYEFDVPGYSINTTTADDYTKAFTLIWKNNIAGAKPLLEILKQQKINYMIPLLLPKDVVVAHKHGDLDPLYHDGGIILSPKHTYVLSIFSNAGDPNLVAHISDLIYTRDYTLVGKTNTAPSKAFLQTPSIDPLVAQGTMMPTQVLGDSTASLTTQPITAADLGITAKDLSLAQPNAKLPRILIPADSPWHVLVDISQLAKEGLALGTKAHSQVIADTMLTQIAEAKDLFSRGKTQQANEILHHVQQTMDTLGKVPSIKADAQAQTTVQVLSETRFQILGDALRNAKGNARSELIKEIGQQAKNTLTYVQPNIPLATNATNPNQKPLIGQIVDKTDTAIIVKTAGGQQITVPITDQTITVKTKEAITIAASPNPTPTEKPTLAAATIGTTIAVVGSSVGNTFTPTFILTNVPKELAAPVPVTVVKVNKANHTMVISENGVPVQVNINNQTAIHGTDTNVSLTAIKPGDVIIVHGTPFQQPAPNSPDTSIKSGQTPTNTLISPTSSALHNTVSTAPTTTPTITPIKSGLTPFPNITSTQKPNISSYPISPLPVTTQIILQKPPTKPAVQQPLPLVPTSQPKVIQSTSIKVIEKKEDVIKTPPATQSKPEQKPQIQQPKPATQANPQQSSQTQTQTKPATAALTTPQITGKK